MILIALLALGILIILQLLYNVLWHPLKAYPGPTTAAASRARITYVTITGQKSVWLQNLHQRYGPVVRVAPNELSYMKHEAVRDIYGGAHANGHLLNDDIVFAAFENDKATILTADEDTHARFRRVFAQFFARQNLTAFEPLFNKYCALLVRRLETTEQNAFDIAELFSFTVFDVMGHLLFGQSLQLLEKSGCIDWARGQPGWIRASVTAAALTEFPIVKGIYQWLLRAAIQKPRKRYFDFANQLMRQRLHKDVHDPDLVAFATSLPKADRISEEEVTLNTPILMLAGTETISCLLSSLVADLLRHHNVLQRLTAEVRATISDPSFISIADVRKLKYLDACIKEAFRRYNPVPEILPRVVGPGGILVAGRWVPGGTRVYVSMYATSNASEYFHNADRFEPDRWLEDPHGLYAGDCRAALQPFSVGKRSCIGQDMTYYTLRLLMCSLLWHFDISSELDVNEWLSGQKAWEVWRRAPLLVRVEQRTSS
ncbi:cytochrome P450 [Aspergillus brunneoviolaceus CBS 621.78]|uniref:Cytochrome P450 n=1 Tax=Aspergillus brunneoviolaceus CBS 621.78 TaxID=1450534 RepID=A0ACD1FSR1_9EURO|nr:cytochrome P450 [Aspergillus brunneoviolaceus CBS 621.78]RAH40028.1 cytochrome P450 [Aspergillus brunneoviolaceus CBS 621.78]